MPDYCAPGYKVHDGPIEVSPKEPQNKLEMLEAAGKTPNKRDGAVRKQNHPSTGKHPALDY